MNEFVVEVSTGRGGVVAARFAKQDIDSLRTAKCGVVLDLSNYKAYVSMDGTITLCAKPDYAEAASITFGDLCIRLGELSSEET